MEVFDKVIDLNDISSIRMGLPYWHFGERALMEKPARRSGASRCFDFLQPVGGHSLDE
jgi:hypothetical protein